MNKIYRDDFDRRMAMLDDIGFVGIPGYVLTVEDREAISKAIADRRAARAWEQAACGKQVAYA